ncbi:MAG TPA: amidohydrolase family protein [Acidimicrobiales bacterium]|nr:amidohydrolase family protein [Acidimicrobiales bacterium]
MAEYDLVVRGGSVVDGTGAPARTADVAVRDGVVVAVGTAGQGRLDGGGVREVDADGCLVTPGFVDIHTHYDGQTTWDTSLAPSSWHGVTTVVMGNCGVGFAPVRPSDHDRLIELMEGVEDIPGAALHEGLSWEWQSFGQYLDALEAGPHDIDFAAQVPHGALRLHVMGERGARREEATEADIAEMGRMAAEAVSAGALGFTTSRTLNHRTSRGEPTPTLTAAAPELAGIAAAIGSTGRGVLQAVSDFIDVEAEFAILRQMVRASGRPLSVSVAQSPVKPDNWIDVLDQVSRMNAEGLPTLGQVAARAVGVLLGLTCTLNPFMFNPVWREIAALTPAEQARVMADPDFRARVLAAQAEMTGKKGSSVLGGRLVEKYQLMYELGDPPDYEPGPGDSLAARAAREGRDGAELAYDICMADEGRSFIYLPSLNYAAGNLDAVGEMLAHPHTVPGLSDGGAHAGTICDVSFPTTLLSYWGRDRERGRMDVAFLVSRQCRETAHAVGLDDRGVLAPGYRADLNVIDFEHLRVRRPEMRYDLPAGGKRLLQSAEGYLHTFVAGTEVYSSGQHTGALVGRLVRGPQPAPAA